MKNTMKAMMAASVAVLMSACEHTTSTSAESAKEEAVKPMVEAEAAGCGPLQASAEITLNENNAPAFGGSSGGGSTPNGGCISFINLAAEGNIDLSAFPPGNVALKIKLDDKAWGAGYRFPADPFQAIGIAVVPLGSTTSPIPQFGQQHWPNQEFGWPTIADGGRSISLMDLDDDCNAYEYGINLIGPNRQTIFMDPRVKNGGGTRQRDEKCLS